MHEGPEIAWAPSWERWHLAARRVGQNDIVHVATRDPIRSPPTDERCNFAANVAPAAAIPGQRDQGMSCVVSLSVAGRLVVDYGGMADLPDVHPEPPGAGLRQRRVPHRRRRVVGAADPSGSASCPSSCGPRGSGRSHRLRLLRTRQHQRVCVLDDSLHFSAAHRSHRRMALRLPEPRSAYRVWSPAWVF